jgi:hypothetical protein
MIKNDWIRGRVDMWYRDPTLEEELAAIALLRAQINLFTPMWVDDEVKPTTTSRMTSEEGRHHGHYEQCKICRGAFEIDSTGFDLLVSDLGWMRSHRIWK